MLVPRCGLQVLYCEVGEYGTAINLEADFDDSFGCCYDGHSYFWAVPLLAGVRKKREEIFRWGRFRRNRKIIQNPRFSQSNIRMLRRAANLYKHVRNLWELLLQRKGRSKGNKNSGSDANSHQLRILLNLEVAIPDDPLVHPVRHCGNTSHIFP